MKKFLLYIFKIFILILLFLIVLDCFYTFVYSNTKVRNKIVNVYNSEPHKYDVIFLGSSRANNHFVAKMFNDKGLKAFNYGMSGARLEESLLLLRVMIERNFKIKAIVLEADLNLVNDGFSEGTRAHFMPYLHQSEIVRRQYESIPEYNYLYYIPFYRYVKYEAKIGFREMFFSAIQKKSSDIQDDGFDALLNQGKNMSSSIVNLHPHRSASYEAIKEICKMNGIRLIVVTTPICSNTDNFGYFKEVIKLYPEIHSYEKAISEDKYFSSCGHMNRLGAQRFTALILKDFFNRQ